MGNSIKYFLDDYQLKKVIKYSKLPENADECEICEALDKIIDGLDDDMLSHITTFD